ncbi:pentapeptide repeat-containing protein [Chryseobacterium sp. JJR-5R]|uniref:pentapeptide repeat-containing protein n=1 Tax=Chryseobacterium sp. JJR-5R TaxID=3093923 RepID=UPI002A75387A|nr:pentapeptide repeat-containing protein [Chryseobacterium sp. JJR-5R]WPO84026.1 pentapeptide repeat-containing protein [Chryseobacterium sp. JJR-5R]
MKKNNTPEIENENENENNEFENRITSLNLDKQKDDEKIKILKCQYLSAESKLVPSGRIEKKDVKFFSNTFEIIEKKRFFYIEDIKYINYLFTRAVATDFIFKNVDFSKTMFDNCYLKDCRFINCKFEGAKFTNSNLQGSYFELCNFDYAIFEKTFVDDEIFECSPKRMNLKYKFARALKLNYTSIGDFINSSKAVSLELDATKSHLKDSWLSGDSFYGPKYAGPKKKLDQLFKWLKVISLDFIWGNGESLKKLIAFNFYIFLLLTIIDIFTSESKYGIFDFLKTLFVNIPSIYFGLEVNDMTYSNYILLPLTILRLGSFALLMSIITKRYNRR